MKSIRSKLLLRVAVLLFILFLVNQILEYKSFREVNINHVKNQSSVIAEIVRDSLTTLMEIGKIDKRDLFLSNIKLEHRNIEEIRVIRGDKVVQQYGEGSENEKPKTEAELKVLQTGIPYENLKRPLIKVSYVLILPYKAEPINRINCLKCHNVEAGAVLGAIYIKTDLTPVRSFTLQILYRQHSCQCLYSL